jgi:hypothetical protein
MRRGAFISVLGTVLILILAIAVVVALADDAGPVEDIPNAQAAIEALPYPFTF